MNNEYVNRIVEDSRENLRMFKEFFAQSEEWHQKLIENEEKEREAFRELVKEWFEVSALYDPSTPVWMEMGGSTFTKASDMIFALENRDMNHLKFWGDYLIREIVEMRAVLDGVTEPLAEGWL